MAAISVQGDRFRMKAIVIHDFGPPEVLKYEDVADPVPRLGEIRVRIHAATVNRVLDVSLRAGKEPRRAPVLPLIPGVDCAGVVDAVGAGVTRWKIGARVAVAGTMPLDPCPEDCDVYAGPTGMMGIKRSGRLRPIGGCASLHGGRGSGRPGFPRRGRDHAARADRLEPAGQHCQARARRDRSHHGGRWQSRTDRHPDRQERGRRQGHRSRRLGRPGPTGARARRRFRHQLQHPRYSRGGDAFDRWPWRRRALRQYRQPQGAAAGVPPPSASAAAWLPPAPMAAPT